MKHFITLATATLMVCTLAYAGPREAKLAMQGPTDPNSIAYLTPNSPEGQVDRIAVAAIEHMQTAAIDPEQFSVTNDPDALQARLDRLKERVSHNTDALLTERDRVVDRLVDELNRAENGRQSAIKNEQDKFNSDARPIVEGFGKKAIEIVSEQEMRAGLNRKRPTTKHRGYNPDTKLKYSLFTLPTF